MVWGRNERGSEYWSREREVREGGRLSKGIEELFDDKWRREDGR